MTEEQEVDFLIGYIESAVADNSFAIVGSEEEGQWYLNANPTLRLIMLAEGDDGWAYIFPRFQRTVRFD